MIGLRERLLWVLLGGLLFAVLILIARHGTVAGLPAGDFASLVYRGVLLVFLGSSVLILFRGRFAQALTAVVMWLAFALVLVTLYSFRAELKVVADRVLAELMPGRTVTRGRSVEVARANTGEFDIHAQINGAGIAMVLDTGASAVILTREDARAAGLPIEVLAYTVTVDTANGRTRAAPVRLDRVAVGGLAELAVEALVAQPGQLKTSLLGMSFLNRLQSWEVRGDRLLLRGFP
jgi:aspartyl protease family protein